MYNINVILKNVYILCIVCMYIYIYIYIYIYYIYIIMHTFMPMDKYILYIYEMYNIKVIL